MLGKPDLEAKLRLVLSAAVTAVALCFTAAAFSKPIPKNWHAPAAWLKDAICIHQHEGAWPDNTGNTYFGGMQFLRSTWERAGGRYDAAFDHPGDHRYPFRMPIREQLYRAYVIWDSANHVMNDHIGSWGEWGTRGACGV